MTTPHNKPPLDQAANVPELGAVDHHLLPKRQAVFKTKMLLSGLVFVSLGALAIFITKSALPQSQNLGSKAAIEHGDAWISFVPSTITPSSTALAKPKLVVRKRGTKKISAIHIELAYDATKITNLTAQVNNWVPGKAPNILEPFTTQVSGNQGRATITLGAPCDQAQCYPIRKLMSTLLTLKFNATGNSAIMPTTNTFITLTGLSENAHDPSMSQSLTIKASN